MYFDLSKTRVWNLFIKLCCKRYMYLMGTVLRSFLKKLYNIDIIEHNFINIIMLYS